MRNPSSKMQSLVLVFGLPAVLLLSLVFRGAYYPVYQHAIFILIAILFLLASFGRISGEMWAKSLSKAPGGEFSERGNKPDSSVILMGMLAFVSILSSFWSIVPASSVSNSFIYTSYVLFLLLLAHGWCEASSGHCFQDFDLIRLWLYIFAIAGALASLTGIIGFFFKAYPWSMLVDGVVVAASCLEYPNGLAVYGLMSLLPTLYLIKVVSGKRRWLIASLMSIQITGIILSFSKTGLIFLAVTVLYALYIFIRLHAGKHWKGVLLSLGTLSLVLLLILALALITGIFNSINSINLWGWVLFDLKPENMLTHRLGTWMGSLDAWMDRSWFGWGAGTFDLAFQGYAQDSLTRHSHNIFLQVGVEFGVLGVAILTMLYMLCFRFIISAVLSFRARPQKFTYLTYCHCEKPLRATKQSQQPKTEIAALPSVARNDRSFLGLYARKVGSGEWGIDFGNKQKMDLRKILAFSCLIFLLSNFWDFTFYIPAITFLFLAQLSMLLFLSTSPTS